MNARQKKKMVYVTEYIIQEIYEPAEGGYYVTECFPIWSVRGTLKAAKIAMRREFKTDQPQIETDTGFITIEHKRGEHTNIYTGYC